MSIPVHATSASATPTARGAAPVRARRAGRARRRLAAITLGAALLTSVAVSASPAAAAEISPNGEPTWGVYERDTDTETDAIRSLVFAIEQIGDRVYVGGKFLEARPDEDGTPVAQPYLAAFDATTGDLLTDFTPQLEGPVYSLQASPDGSRLFVGGEYRSINGDNEARGLAALDPITGAVDRTWRAKVTSESGARGVVHSMTIDGGQLYLAGRFDRVGGGPQPLHYTDKLARVDLATGAVDTSLSVDIAGGAVWGVAVAPDGSKIYLAGYHDSVNGDPAGADFSVINATDGTLFSALSDTGGNANPDRRYGQDIVAVGDHVFWAGSEHIVRVFRISDGQLVTEHSTDRGGDYQDLEVVGDRVYAACHCYTNHMADFNWWPVRNDPVPPSVAVTPIRYVTAYSAATGAHIPEFSLDVSAARSGVWAIHGDTAGCLWIGGDVSRLTTVNGNDRAAGGFAKFCEGNGSDGFAPSEPGNLVQTRSENRLVVIRWDSSTDNIGVDRYEIFRDGVLHHTRDHTGASQYWMVDSFLTQGTTYTYEVVAIDAAGNRSTPATVDASTTGTAPGQAPPAPTGLRSTLQTRERIVLTWDSVAGAELYRVERWDGAAFVEATLQSGRWFTDLGREAGTAYTYRVLALGPEVDGTRPVSEPSDELVVTTQP